MRSKVLAALLGAGLMIGAFAPQPGLAAKKSGPVVVGEDADDDWGMNVATGLSPVGDLLGQELVEASIGMADKETVNFIITVKSLPPTGGVPELSRYVWGISVDGDYVELDGKWSNYSRGACDPTSGQCPPPRDPGMQPFLVRANCMTDPNTNTTLCEEVGIVHAVFDGGAGTITIPVPLDLIGAKAGSKIAGGQEQFLSTLGGNVAALPSAFVSNTAGPTDGLTITKIFKVPGKKKK